MAYATDWGNVYNTAVNTFSKDIREKSQADLETGRGLLVALADPKDGTASLLGALVALDKLKFGSPDPKIEKAAVASYETSLKALKTAATEYDRKLDKALATEIAGKTKRTPLKTFAPESYRNLKLLKTQLASIVARAEQALAAKKAMKEIDKIGAAQAKGMDKAKTEAERKAVEAEARLQKLLVTLGPNFKSAIQKAKVAIQQIKAKPDAVTYNAQMNNAGRDISQTLVNISNMKSNADLRDSKKVKAIPDPGNLANEIAVFGNGASRTVNATATKADVTQKLNTFSDLVKRIEAHYNGKL